MAPHCSICGGVHTTADCPHKERYANTVRNSGPFKAVAYGTPCAHCGLLHEGMCKAPGDTTGKQRERFGRLSTPEERIKRLRDRLKEVKPPHAHAQLVGVMQGILDLLGDEL